MKPLPWAFRFACVASAGLLAPAAFPGRGGSDQCGPACRHTGSAENSEDQLRNTSKLSDGLRIALTKDGMSSFEVMIVLNVPKPDLSHMFGSSLPSKDSVGPKMRDAAIDAAEEAVSGILKRSGGKEIRRFRNAASILAQTSRTTLEELITSDFVLEIVENQRLSKD